MDMLTRIFFSLVTYWVIGLNPKFHAFLLFTIVLILNVLVRKSMSLLVSSLFMEVKQAQVLGSLSVLSSMLISGYSIDTNNTPAFVRPFRYLSFIKIRGILNSFVAASMDYHLLTQSVS